MATSVEVAITILLDLLASKPSTRTLQVGHLKTGMGSDKVR